MAAHSGPNAIHSAVPTRKPAVSQLSWLLLIPIVGLALLALVPSAIRASDHADPMDLRDPEANITGLFLFPRGDQMVLVFNVRRSLRKPKPYNLEPYEYVINMDLTTPVTLDNEADRIRYGGTVVTPEKIHADAAITVHLNNDATLKSIAYRGLKNTDRVRTFAGVRDDPFIFPRFFKKNVISMVLSIPISAFPDGQQNFILWGTTSKDGKQIDHVGRSIRTQLPRFEALNTLPPSEHVKEVMQLMEKWDDISKFLKSFREWWVRALADFLETTLLIRPYDRMADVMIYSNRFPPGFPNGRRLEDDVVLGVCQAGDCLLVDLAAIEGAAWPRQTVNDKEFLPDFPYLAEPWPDEPEPPAPTKSIWPYVALVAIVVAIVGWIAVEIVRRLILWLLHWWRRRAVPAT
jgi:hypothetical protein